MTVAVFGTWLVACEGGATTPDAGVATVDALAPAVDARSTPPADARVTDASSTNLATLTGVVTRSAMPAAGGVGHLYIAVFTADPVTAAMDAMMVANVRIDDVDMSAPNASVSYTLPGIPPRAEPYFITAFLDDNDTVVEGPPETAGPDRGDLVAIDGFASPKVTVTVATTVDFDIDVNFNLPF